MTINDFKLSRIQNCIQNCQLETVPRSFNIPMNFQEWRMFQRINTNQEYGECNFSGSFHVLRS